MPLERASCHFSLTKRLGMARRSSNMAKSKAESPFTGRWQIVSMDAWDVEDVEEPTYIEFDGHGGGDFQFASVQGVMDCRPSTRGEEPAVEWTWEGGDEDEAVTGR